MGSIPMTAPPTPPGLPEDPVGITRIAPTPSGFLHEGNAVNALLVHWLTAQDSGSVRTWQVALRIDDDDAARMRIAYVADIFDVLTWLAIPWTLGPSSLDAYLHAQAEHSARASARARVEWEAWRQQLLDLRDGTSDGTAAGLRTFVCGCSRADLRRAGMAGCPADCASRSIAFTPGETAVRLRLPDGLTERMNGEDLDLSRLMPDAVLWRRDDVPAYHLASVQADELLGTTHIVRGADLRGSSALHRVLARALGARRAADARYLHHGLVTGPQGEKLSKSQQKDPAPLPRTAQLAQRIHHLAVQLGAPLGIHPPSRT